ncbi:putative deoxyguanosinetriphosphate triphosphohydrolase [Escherichia coli]|nr:putative deoxyguanosinetriphosphate triphosphohydrolase [Escherichia coli]
MKEHIFGEIPTGIVVERDVPALLAAIGLAHDLGNPPFGIKVKQRCAHGLIKIFQVFLIKK